MIKNNFAWQPIAVGYGVSLVAIIAAIIYALLRLDQREITVLNLSTRTVKAEVATSTRNFKMSIKAGTLWRVSVLKSEIQQWNLKVFWKASMEKLEVRESAYEQCDSLIKINLDGYSDLPSECD